MISTSTCLGWCSARHPGSFGCRRCRRAVVEAAAGVVNTRTRVPVAPDSVFQIQSITKVWTATLIMQLVDDGLVNLDDPVRAYVPEFRTADPAVSESITIRHLLTHTGGFEGDLWKATTTGDDALQRLVEDCVPELPQSEAPGLSLLLLQRRHGGARQDRRDRTSDAVRRRAPLVPGRPARHRGDRVQRRRSARLQHGHGTCAPGDRGMRPLPVWATFPESNAPAGNHLAMSARALLSFGRMHLADGLAPDGARLLTEASAKAMRTPDQHPCLRPRPETHRPGMGTQQRRQRRRPRRRHDRHRFPPFPAPRPRPFDCRPDQWRRLQGPLP